MRTISSYASPMRTGPANPVTRCLESLRYPAAALLMLSLAPWCHAEAISVRTVRLGDVLAIPEFSAPATVVARNAPSPAAEIAARIEDILVKVGDRVTADDLLVRLDCRRYESLLAARQAAVDRARAQQAFAEQQLERARNLQRKKSISEELLDQRRTDLATAEADLLASEQEVRLAEIDVGHCDVRAPVDAVVTERATSVGSYANVGTVLLNLLEAEGQEVSVALRHDQADGLQAAETVVFSSDETDYPVMLRTLLPRVDPVARTREARLVFTGEAAVAGTPGRVVWYGERSMLPPDYLVRRGGRLGVFVLDADRARFIDIPDAQDGRPAVLQLAPETLVISEGRQRLVDNDLVKPIAAGETR